MCFRLENRLIDGDSAEIRDVGLVFVPDVVEEASDRERLAVSQLNLRLSVPSGQRRYANPTRRDAIGEVQRADLRTNVESNDVSRDRRLELQPHAIFLVLHVD